MDIVYVIELFYAEHVLKYVSCEDHLALKFTCTKIRKTVSEFDGLKEKMNEDLVKDVNNASNIGDIERLMRHNSTEEVWLAFKRKANQDITKIVPQRLFQLAYLLGKFELPSRTHDYMMELACYQMFAMRLESHRFWSFSDETLYHNFLRNILKNARTERFREGIAMSVLHIALMRAKDHNKTLIVECFDALAEANIALKVDAHCVHALKAIIVGE